MIMKKESKIISQLAKLCQEECSSTVLELLMKAAIETNSDDSLMDEMKLQLSLQGYNIIKAETLTEQLQIEESFKAIVPYYTQQETQFQIAY